MIKLHELNTTAIPNQVLLFDRFPTVMDAGAGEYTVPAAYYNDGFTILSGIADEKAACEVLYRFVAGLVPEKLGFPRTFIDKTQLATLDFIPNCDEIVKTGFQALHFDMGQPIISEKPETMYTINALYRPANSAENKSGKTRIVNIEKLFSQQTFGSAKDVEARLIDYVKKYGDGWTEPTPVNSLRLACFARVLDAVSGANQLTDKINTQIGQCFQYDETEDGLNGLAQEYAFFKQFGLDLAAAEEQIVISPGQLLIIDNLRCVHGRVGKRFQRELANILFGVKDATPEEIDHYRGWLANSVCGK